MVPLINVTRSAPVNDGMRLAPDALPLRPILAFNDPEYERDFVGFYNSFYYRYAQVSPHGPDLR